MSYKVGDKVWVPHAEDAWIGGLVVAAATGNKVLDVRTAERGIIKANTNELELAGSHIDDNVDNLVDLDELSEGAILHHVRKRFKNKKIYTFVGVILVAVNPFENLPIYTAADITKAQNSRSNPTYPHVFVTAAYAYNQLMMNSKNQAVLISGESGAGKTETTKKVLNYLATIAPASNKVGKSDTQNDKVDEVGIEEKILQSNPLLEALGNAKTLRNNNSSRFGKWMKVNFDGNYRIQGCEIVNYLLEKSRVVYQSQDERNYHIFYQIIRGLDDATRGKLHLRDVDYYNYLIRSNCTAIPGVDDKLEFKDVLDSLKTLGFDDDLILNVFAILSAILLLGNLHFVKTADISGSESCDLTIESKEIVGQIAALLNVDNSTLVRAMREKTVQMGKGSVVVIKLNKNQASDCRDTLVKTLYGNLFDWTVQRINDTLKNSNVRYSIGILDIFGFEVFDSNSFEQLCINYANEKLQFHFNEVIFQEEMKMYEWEGIPLNRIVFVDNSECVKLIEGKPYGLILLLDEECSLGNGTDASYINKIDKVFGKDKPNYNAFFIKHRTKPTIFSVKHFAGPVEYDITNFIDKNRDTLSVTCKECMISSTSKLISSWFAESTADSKVGNRTSNAAPSGGKSSKVTLGSQFRNQLIGLVDTLRLSEPHFIRCVKPNHQKSAGLFDGQLALRQLRYAGLFEAIRIRKSGFSYRTPLNVFANSFQQIVDMLPKQRRLKLTSDADACNIIIKKVIDDKVLQPDVAFVGKTKVFLKSNNDRNLLELLLADKVTVYCIRLQALIRGFLTRMEVNKIKYEKQKLEAKLEAERLAEEARVEAIRIAEEVRVEAIRIAEEARVEAIRIAEEERLAALRVIHTKYSIIVQKYIRRYLIQRMMVSMKDIIELRRSLAKRDVKKIQFILTRMEKFHKRTNMSKRPNHSIEAEESSKSMVFEEEIRAGKVMLRYIEIQDRFASDVNDAIIRSDVAMLNQLLIQSVRLGLDNHPLVEVARVELERLSRKKKVMISMVNFLNIQDVDSLESISQTLSEAQEIGVDTEFIYKVQTIYDNVGPRLRSRTRLRRSIEAVDETAITSSLVETEKIRLEHSDFAEIEVRAAYEMLKLLKFERILYSSGTNSSGSTSIDDVLSTVPRLTHDIISLCDTLSSTSDTVNTIILARRKAAIKELYTLLNNNKDMLEMIVRSYKWYKILCVWKFPEITKSLGDIEDTFDREVSDGQFTAIINTHKDCEEFYGLRLHEGRSTTHIIRSLHHDVIPIYGDAPGSILAALGIPTIDPALDEMLKMVTSKDKYVSLSADSSRRLLKSSSSSSNFKTPTKNPSNSRASDGMSIASSTSSHGRRQASAGTGIATSAGVTKELLEKLKQSRANLSQQKKISTKTTDQLKLIRSKVCHF